MAKVPAMADNPVYEIVNVGPILEIANSESLVHTFILSGSFSNSTLWSRTARLLGHVAAWRMLSKRTEGLTLVIEDTAEIADLSDEIIDPPFEWDFCSIDDTFKFDGEKAPIRLGIEQVTADRCIPGAYLLKNRALTALISNFTPLACDVKDLALAGIGATRLENYGMSGLALEHYAETHCSRTGFYGIFPLIQFATWKPMFSTMDNTRFENFCAGARSPDGASVEEKDPSIDANLIIEVTKKAMSAEYGIGVESTAGSVEEAEPVVQ